MAGTEKLRADVRIIAATNKDLRQEMKKGRFRQDLYFRICVIEIYIPPLRERKEDIPILAEEILKRESRRSGSEKALGPEALDRLLAHDWPGNIRELENVLKRAMVFCDDYKIRAEAVQLDEISHYPFLMPRDSGNYGILQRYKDMVGGRKNFWEVVHNPFLQRELKREEVITIIKMGLKEAGTYKKLMELFNAGQTQSDYKRFMKVLNRHGINPHFRGIKSP